MDGGENIWGGGNEEGCDGGRRKGGERPNRKPDGAKLRR